ncbi:MBL fold metallo-hydrolase [Pseudoalteromonas sp. SSDWG2]|uniref:MBL fold metallo-hydrolase n=1 Tax=Pseudoalteromonas sp. SSDWG2 TaxID=3139391 RepID=UPI003BAC34D3
MQIHTVPVTPFMQNCRIVVCEKTNDAAIVDPGGDTHKLIAKLNRLNITPSTIWLTHGHLDHVGAADELAREFNIDIIGPHADEQFWFDALPQQAQMFGFAPRPAFLPTRWLTPGEVLTLGELNFEVRLCPGHTPGHVILVEHQNKIVLVGDVIFKGSIGRTDFPKGDGPTLIASIHREVLSLADDYSILSGHGEDTTVGHERQTNPFVSGKFG